MCLTIWYQLICTSIFLQFLQAVLSPVDVVSHTAAQILAAYGAVDVEGGHWPQLLPALLDNISNHEVAMKAKISSLEVRTYVHAARRTASAACWWSLLCLPLPLLSISLLTGIASCYSNDLLTLDQLYVNVLLLLENLYDQPGMRWDGTYWWFGDHNSFRQAAYLLFKDVHCLIQHVVEM